MKTKFYLTLVCCLFLPSVFFGQFRKFYQDTDSSNAIHHINIQTNFEGYVAFDNWLGYTLDSGHTFAKKYITPSNVDFNGYSPSLTLGFTINGTIYASKDSLLIYGHYDLTPSVLLSVDKANSFKLIYYSSQELDFYNKGVEKIRLPVNSSTGYAVETHQVLMTTNHGKSWFPVVNDQGTNFFDIVAPDAKTAYAISETKLLKTSNGGSLWEQLIVPAGSLQSISFLTPDKGWIVVNNTLYLTTNGGKTWQAQNDPELYPCGYALNFVSDTTGYFLGGQYTVFKTTDGGKIWEPLRRDNSFEFLNYSHYALSIPNSYSMWAGGGYGFLEYSGNGGITLPKAVFRVDTTGLSSSNRVQLKNYSKKGYRYKWLLNSQVYATSYDTSFQPSRTSIDTIQLIVTSSGKSDTARTTFYLGNTIVVCSPTFESIVDSSSVSFKANDNNAAIKHYWDFGDGTIDSTQANPIHIYKKVGTYTVTHRILNTSNNCTGNTFKTVTVVCPIYPPDFTYVTDSLQPYTVKFNNPVQSYNSSNQYALVWYFGDGDSSAMVTPTHQYRDSGTYTVTMRYTHLLGCQKELSKTIAMGPRKCSIEPAFTMERGPVYHDEITFTNTSKSGQAGNLSTQWDISNGTSSSLQNFKYRFPAAGSYVVRLTTKSSECTAIKDSVIVITKDDLCHLKPLFSQDVRDNEVLLDPMGDPGDPIPNFTYTWSLGDGNSSNSPFAFNHSYAKPGNYNVCLNWYVDSTCSRTVCDTIRITTPPPPPCTLAASFTYAIDSLDAYLVNFKNNSTSKDSTAVNTYYWSFGDGNSSSAKDPVYNFKKPGVFTINLGVDNGICYKSFETTVTIIKKIIPCLLAPAFTYTTDPNNPARISFHNSTSGTTNNTAFTWYFGNGDSSRLSDPVYTFDPGWNYTVRLKAVEESIGCAKETTSVIGIPSIQPCPDSVRVMKSVDRNDVSLTSSIPAGQANTIYYWDFGDGSFSNDPAPVHRYEILGTYTICLTATSGSCQFHTCDTVVINTANYKRVAIYPNPVTSNFILQYTAAKDEQVKIEFLTETGSIIKTDQRTATIGINQYNYNFAGLRNGFYYIRITTNQGVISFTRFVKM